MQAGIQTAHAAIDLVTKNTSDVAEGEVPWNWALNHKTIILLRGGSSSYLKELTKALKRSNLNWADFHEDQQSLEGARTCVVVVVDSAKLQEDLETPNDPRDERVYEFIRESSLASS